MRVVFFALVALWLAGPVFAGGGDMPQQKINIIMPDDDGFPWAEMFGAAGAVAVAGGGFLEYRRRKRG